MKRLLVACECSGVVREAFKNKGWQAWSCDLKDAEGEGSDHYKMDIFEMLKMARRVGGGSYFDMMIAHPPCTHLSKAGAWCWKFKKEEQKKALEFVKKIMDSDVPMIAIENPVGKINTAIRKPDQRIQPWYFGDPWTKETCLWLKGLPPLMATDHVEPRGNWVKPGNKRPWRKFDDVPEGGRRNSTDRSRTFRGIAQAMADQWGNL